MQFETASIFGMAPIELFVAIVIAVLLGVILIARRSI